MITRNHFFLGAFLLVSTLGVFGQIPGFPSTEEIDQFGVARGAEAIAQERLALALASPVYPVTPGDEYSLSFTVGGLPTTALVRVQSDNVINLNLFGEIDTTGLTYSELRRQVESMVSDAYPQSMPSFRLVSIGVFEVTVRGAIAQTSRVNAWGLSRLSEVTQSLFQPYSSTRQVVVTNARGENSVYDLFQAFVLGENEEDPYLRPGDSVRVFPVGTLVRVSGEVNRPGRYETILGETVRDVIGFAGGFSPDADRRQVRLSRFDAGTGVRERFDFATDSTGPIVRDGDSIFVDSILEQRPVVFFEGAFESSEPQDPTTQTIEILEPNIQDIETAYLRISQFHYEGMMLSEALAELRDQIGTFADLAQAAVIRADTNQLIEIDAGQVLYDYGDAEDIELEPYDTVFIPSRLLSVLVTGPVAEPGLYLYVPGRPPEYYIRRAGGYDREISRSGEYVIYDKSGDIRSGAVRINPGDRIEIQRDNFVYQFNRHFPVIVSGLTIITTVITTFAVINQ